MEVEVKPVQILTIKDKIQLFKGEEAANSIELIQFKENGFEVVAQKNLYQINDLVVYIQPDYSLPNNISLFDSYINPSVGSCKLGGNNRIRAIKFNLHRGDNNPVYSQGILLPYLEVQNYINSNKKSAIDLHVFDLTKELGITKWEEPDNTKGGGLNTKGGKTFPSWMYKTDETNINNLWNYIETKIGYPITLVATEKIDGSSLTFGYKQGFGPFVCSRNLLKNLIIKKVVGRRNKTLFEKLLFWRNFDLNVYQETPNIEDDFVRYSKYYLEKITEHCIAKKVEFIVRAELNGSHLKGSGNKNNPARLEEANIKVFGTDHFENGMAKKSAYATYKAATDYFQLPRCKEVFNRSFNSRQEIEEACNEYFKTNLIEGLVLRTLDSSFSAKYMNCHYDSLK